MDTTIEYEVIGLLGPGLEARYRMGDKEMLAFVPWDGVEDIQAALRRVASGVANAMRQPPPPSEAARTTMIGTRGSVEVPVGTPPGTSL